MRVLAARIASHTGKDVVVKGWVHRIRELGGISFIILRDRSGEVQLVLEGSADLTLESVISVKGRVEANEKAPGGAEIHVGEIEVLARAEPDLPIPINQDPSQLSLDALLDHRMLSLRIPKIRTIFTLQAGLVQYFADYLRSQGFSEIKTSKLIATGTEGGPGCSR